MVSVLLCMDQKDNLAFVLSIADIIAAIPEAYAAVVH